MLRLPCLLFVSSALLAQGPSSVPAPIEPAPPAQILLSTPFHGMWIDGEPARDGRYWCRGDRYKMSFGPAGASYVPLLGWRAPRAWPLGFRLAGFGEAAPERRGDGFVFRHPGVEERWELRPDGAEQSFVLQQRPAGNTLTIEIETDLQYVGSDDKGLHFVAAGWGEVVYGNAVAIEPDGDRFALRTALAAGAIRIELPPGAAYPLLVDPFVSTIGVASNEVADNRNPDVAFDSDSARWCVAMEERVSALDTDIKVRRFNSAGVLLDTDFFETSGAIADQPAVASARSVTAGTGEFCVVWQETSRDIVARRIGAANATPFGAVTIFTGLLLGGDVFLRPDVAGSQVGTYLVVSVYETPVFPPAIRGMKLSGNSASPPFTLVTSAGCVTPHVAAAMPPDHDWPITWNRQASGCLGGDVHLMVLNQSLGQELQPTVIAGSVFDDDRHVDVAWNGGQGLVVWDRDQGSHHDIFGRAFQRTPSGYSLLGSESNLTTLEPGITVGADQQQPVIASDGVRFVVAYMEGAVPKPVCATFGVNGSVVECHEGHVPIATAPLDHDDMGIAAMGTSGGALTRYFVVTDERDGSNDYDVQGLFYDGRQPGTSFTVVATGCVPFHFAEPQLAVTGGTLLDDLFTVTLSGHRALPFILVGVPMNPTQLLCTAFPASQCRQGVQLPLLLSNFGTTLNVQVPRDVGLVGLTLAFQGADLLATAACGSSLFGVAFAVTDTIQATIR
ncbi:MAG: hypothetical protein ABIP94_24070 [Planctomycetota bacterium]